MTLKSQHIPRATIQRMAVYIQVLETLQRDGMEVISRSCSPAPVM
jgi:redox-sensing transcriptional repressor